MNWEDELHEYLMEHAEITGDDLDEMERLMSK